MKTKVLFVNLIFIFAIVNTSIAAELINKDTSVSSNRIRYAVTIHPLSEIIKKVVGSRAEVIKILPPGASPHTFAPRPSIVKDISGATAFFYAGPGVDQEWVGKLAAKNKIEMLSLVPEVDRLDVKGVSSEAGKEHGHENNDHNAISYDPHFWTDPLTVKKLLPELINVFSELDKEGTHIYKENAQYFAEELTALDLHLKNILAPAQGKAFFLFHPSFQYLFRRYNLTLGGVIEQFPGQEPSPKKLLKIVKKLRNSGTRYIFSEPQLSPQAAGVVAEAAEIDVLVLDPLGGTKGRQSYSELILYNAEALLKASAPL